MEVVVIHQFGHSNFRCLINVCNIIFFQLLNIGAFHVQIMLFLNNVSNIIYTINVLNQCLLNNVTNIKYTYRCIELMTLIIL